MTNTRNYVSYDILEVGLSLSVFDVYFIDVFLTLVGEEALN